MPLMVPDKVNMNYANMIEEKNLKKGFIVATLVSTLVGTFAASHNLWERLSNSQKKKDGDQDDKLKKLTDEIESLKQQNSKPLTQGRPDDFQQSLNSSRQLIRNEFDAGFSRLGQRFAIGDILAENQLQAQIIMVQQTIIGVLEDALYNGRQIDRADISKLTAASRSAREGSLNALRGQYQRLLQDAGASASRAAGLADRPRDPRLVPPPTLQTQRIRPPSPSMSSKTTAVRSPVRGALPPLLMPAIPSPPASSTSSGGLFCRYSLDLQRMPHKPLVASFDPGRDSRCPACRVRVDVESDDMWDFKVRSSAKSVRMKKDVKTKSPDRGWSRGRDTVKEVVEEKQKTRVFKVPARFVVKCHTESGEYACVMCCDPHSGGKDLVEVVLCADPEALVSHVAKAHKVGEMEREVDILED